MSKSAKQVANELGVSRQRVQQIIEQLPASKKPHKASGRYVININGEKAIKSVFYSNPVNKKQASTSKQFAYDVCDDANQGGLNADLIVLRSSAKNLRAQLQASKEQLEVKDKQLESKDTQIKELHNLLDQQQRLNLSIQEIFNKKQFIEEQKNVPNNKSNSVNVEDTISKEAPTMNKKRGLWHKLFK